MSVIMRNDIEVGGTDDDVIAKVGTDQLTTQADDLSGAVNELNSSKVITLTNTSSWLFSQNVMQNNKVVSLYLELTGITTTETVVGVLPSDARPSKRIIKDCIVINNNANAVLGQAHFVINTNGNITCKAFGSYSNNFVTLDVSYIL